MKRYITRLLAFCMVLMITFVVVQLSNAATAPAPGSNDDPLVTKSYIDKKVKDLEAANSALSKSLNDANAIIEGLKKDLQTANKTISNLKKDVANAANTGAYFEVKKNKTLVLEEGSMAVLYSGSASIAGPSGANISDLTTGKALKPGVTVPKRHLLSSAISDSRGIKAKSNIFVVVSGKYKIN